MTTLTPLHAPGKRMNLNALLKQAVGHHRAGKLDLAEEIYSLICNTDSSNLQVFYLRGLIAQEKGEYVKAIALFGDALRKGSGHPEIYAQLARTHNLAGDPHAALENYRKALSIDPINVDALCNSANIMGQIGLFKDALINYGTALELSPESPTINYNAGTLHLQQFQPEKAIRYFENAIRLKPDYASAHNSLGVALTDSGMPDSAIGCFRRANELDKQFVEPLFNLHGIYLDQGNTAESLKCLTEAVAIAPGNLTYRFFLGLLHRYVGDAKAGTDCLAPLRDKNEVRAEMESLDYLCSLGPTLPNMTGSNLTPIKLAIENARIEGLVMEFGVYNGKSIRLIASLVDSIVHGFDSFEGIPEEWVNERKGSYSAFGVLPEVPDNVILHPGWFEDSIPEFIKNEKWPIRFINIDCDLYSSTKTIFDLLGPQIVSGSVILFDEFIGYPTWKDDEFKAFQEATERFNWTYEILCFSFMTKQVAIKIK